MLDDRGSSRAARGWRLIAVLGGTGMMIAGHLAWDAERRNTGLHDEVRWLRARLGEKRELVARQRREMAEVANAVDRLARTTTVLRERSLAVRRQAHMEETRDWTPDLLTVRTTLDGGMSIMSEDAAYALERLAWMDEEAAAAGDSLVVLGVLLGQRADEATRGVPGIWPVRGRVTSHFGTRMSPYGEGRTTHAGIDIAARYGAPVSATGAGSVAFAGWDAGYGGLVVIDHGGRIATLYAHLSALYVRKGQSVRRGQAIGAVGATGRATGVHLHYEVRVSGAPVDPRQYLGQPATDRRLALTRR